MRRRTVVEREALRARVRDRLVRAAAAMTNTDPDSHAFALYEASRAIVEMAELDEHEVARRKFEALVRASTATPSSVPAPPSSAG